MNTIKTESEKLADQVREALLRGLLDTVTKLEACSPEERLRLQSEAASVLNQLDPARFGFGSYATLRAEKIEPAQ